jgi:hypothetical protein
MQYKNAKLSVKYNYGGAVSKTGAGFGAFESFLKI